MKNRNTYSVLDGFIELNKEIHQQDQSEHLAMLIVKEYTRILYRYYRQGKASASEITDALANYMRELGLPRQVIVLAVAAYISLL